MSSILLIEIRVPNYRGDVDTVVVAEWQKQRGSVLRITGRPDRVYATAEGCIRDAVVHAHRAAKEALQP